MGAAPLALVRGAIDAATAAAWLEAIDAHPSWQRRGAGDAAACRRAVPRRRGLEIRWPEARRAPSRLGGDCFARVP
jgi:hypothetical protein